MAEEKQKVNRYLNASTEIAKAKTRTFSPTSMKLIVYGLYKLARSFDLKKYKDVNLLNKDTWTTNSWEDFTCTFTTAEFCEALKIGDGGTTRLQIEKAIDRAFEEKIKLKNEDTIKWFPWFVEAAYYHPASSTLETSIGKSDDNSITFTFHPGVLAIALNQKQGYAHIDLLSYGKLKSTYSLKWFQIIQSRYNMKGEWGNAPGTWTTENMTIDDLKELFGISLDLYINRVNNFLDKVLRNPIKEINSAGLNYSVEIKYKRGEHNKIKSFYLLCKEKVEPCIVSKYETTEIKQIAYEHEQRDREIQEMKEKYPNVWAEWSEKIKATTDLPLFGPYVEAQILSKLKELGYN